MGSGGYESFGVSSKSRGSSYYNLVKARCQGFHDRLDKDWFVKFGRVAHGNRCVWSAGEAPRPTQNTLG